MARFDRLKYVDFNNNPWIFPPSSVMRCNKWPSIRAYLESSRDVAARTDVLLLLGDGGCGKTTFSRALRIGSDDDGSRTAVLQLVSGVRDAILRWQAGDMRLWVLELVLRAMRVAVTNDVVVNCAFNRRRRIALCFCCSRRVEDSARQCVVEKEAYWPAVDERCRRRNVLHVALTQIRVRRRVAANRVGSNDRAIDRKGQEHVRRSFASSNRTSGRRSKH